MDCTIGWTKTKTGYVLFKNRDTKREYLKDNLFQKEEKLVKIGYKSDRKGCWIGINKYGIGFTSSKGPYREMPEDYLSWIKFNEIGEFVLKKVRNLDEAVKLFIKIYKKQKIGESANILFGNNNKAYLLEFCLDKINIKAYSNFVFRANHFESMKRINSYFRSLDTSKSRLKKFRELFKKTKPKKSNDLISLLTYHSKNKNESICRHGKIMTVGSSIFEVSKKNILIYYSINENPCKGKFNKREISFS